MIVRYSVEQRDIGERVIGSWLIGVNSKLYECYNSMYTTMYHKDGCIILRSAILARGL